MQTNGNRGALVRKQCVGDGMDLSRGNERLPIRFEKSCYGSKEIRVSVRREKKSEIYNIKLGCQVGIKEGSIFLKEIRKNSALIAYYAPDFGMERVEHYESFDRGRVLLMEGEKLQFYGNANFSLLVKKIWRKSAKVKIEGLEGLDDSIIKYMGTGFFDGIEVRVAPSWIKHRDKIMFWYAVPRGYSVRKR